MISVMFLIIIMLLGSKSNISSKCWISYVLTLASFSLSTSLLIILILSNGNKTVCKYKNRECYIIDSLFLQIA